MQQMKFFLDTHDQRSNTLPAGITKEQFAEFFTKYEKAAREEGVVVLRAHIGFEEGRAYCFDMAPSADHVRRAHERAGLPFETWSGNNRIRTRHGARSGVSRAAFARLVQLIATSRAQIRIVDAAGLRRSAEREDRF